MRFKIDENLHEALAVLLADNGHDVETVHTEGLRGCDDKTLAHHCQNEQRVLVTLDRDFADIREFTPADYSGILVFRVGSQSRGHILMVMAKVLDLLNREPIAGRLWIASDADVRIRS